MDNYEKKLEDKYGSSTSKKLMYAFIFLAVVGLFTVLWYFIFKEESIGKQILEKGTKVISDTGKQIFE